jgi:hypothetical protein
MLSVNNGTLATPITISLPTSPSVAGCKNATTPLQGFMVPLGTNVQTLTFSGGIPGVPNGQYLPVAGTAALAVTGSNSSSNTLNAAGVFPAPVPLSNAAFELDAAFGATSVLGYPVTGTTTNPATPNVLIDSSNANPGKWLIGVACTVNGSANPAGGAENVWDVEVDFTSTPANGGASWVIPTGSGPVVPEAPLAIALPIGGVAMFGLAIYVNRRRRSGSEPVTHA